VDSISDLWIDGDIVGENIPPPVVTREQTLPFGQLSWENFERLCVRLASRGNDVADYRRYGVHGQDQQGIDLFVRRRSDGYHDSWQCKRYEEFDPSDIQKAVDKFLGGDWASRTRVFHLVVSTSLVPTALAEAVEVEAKKCQARGIEFVPLDSDRLSKMLKRHPDLVDDFFGREWVKAFCGAEASTQLKGRKLTKMDRLRARNSLLVLYQTYFASVDAGLPAAAPTFRQAVRPLALQKRFIMPMVDGLTSVLEFPGESESLVKEGSSSNVNGEGDSKNKSSRKPSNNGLRLLEQRTTSGLFPWLASADRVVLLGGPGLGKSASLRFVAMDLLSTAPQSDVLARKWGAYIPVYIPFAYVTRIASKDPTPSIPDCCRAWFRELSASPDELAILDAALEDERVLLLIDGLDEWSDINAAGAAITKLQTFVENRALPTIVSARRLGYDRLGNLGAEWQHGELLPFESTQQREFTTLWFHHMFSNAESSGETFNPKEAAGREADALMQELDSEPALSDLAGIPLLLSALIYLRLRGHVLPQNRFDVLKAISDTLIAEQPTRRDRASLQGIGPTPHARKLAELGIEVLAIGIHEQSGSDSITEGAALDVLAKYYEGASFRKSASEAGIISAELVDRAKQSLGILVERQTGHIGFIHRSLQEHFAAKGLTRRSFEELKAFVAEKLDKQDWHEIILETLHLLDRSHEIDELLCLIRDAPLPPLADPIRQILLVQAICGNVNCSASVANELLETFFTIAETGAWMPLRMSIVTALVRGIDAEHVGSQIRLRLQRWFPGRSPWRWGLAAPLVENPVPSTGLRLFTALFNCDGDAERKEMALALGAGASHWPELAEKIYARAIGAEEPEITLALIVALATGWPQLAELSNLLLQASESPNDDVRLVALIYRAQRGDTTSAVKEALSDFFKPFSHLYPWEIEAIDVMVRCWPQDNELKSIALTSARQRIMPTKWDDRMALRYLMKAYPGDDEVAQIVAEKLSKEEHINTVFDRSEGWADLHAGFNGHPIVAAAAEDLVKKYSEDRYREMEVAQLASLCGPKRGKEILLEFLQKLTGRPIWTLSTLVEIAGPHDGEVIAAARPYIEDDTKATWIAGLLPDLIIDQAACRDRLLHLLAIAKDFGINHVLRGLARVGTIGDTDTVSVIDRRLTTDSDGRFWANALLEHLPQHPPVRAAALQMFDYDEPPISSLANAYASDEEIRGRLEEMLDILHEDLRREIVRGLAVFTLRRNDRYARDLLGQYRLEWHGETRVAACATYHSALRKLGEPLEVRVAELTGEFKRFGHSYTERTQAALAGLLALGLHEQIRETLTEESNRSTLSLYSSTQINWDLVQALVQEWEGLLRTCGENVWELFGSWDVIVYQLERTGKRDLALQVPKPLETKLISHIEQDLDGFRALTVIQRDTDALKDLCLSLFARFCRPEGSPQSIGWGYNEIEVIVAAAHYLADHHGGDSEVERRLKDILKTAVENTGPIIALCRGWPAGSAVRSMWSACNGQPLNAMPATAWLVATHATAQEFACYMSDIVKSLRERNDWFRFPGETLRALRHRLSRDVAAQKLVLKLLKEIENLDNQCGTIRLMSTSGVQREAMTGWVNEKIAALRIHQQLATFTFDINRNFARPMELSLLDALLTR